MIEKATSSTAVLSRFRNRKILLPVDDNDVHSRLAKQTVYTYPMPVALVRWRQLGKHVILIRAQNGNTVVLRLY